MLHSSSPTGHKSPSRPEQGSTGKRYQQALKRCEGSTGRVYALAELNPTPPQQHQGSTPSVRSKKISSPPGFLTLSRPGRQSVLAAS